jgi:hypothetical protein
MHHVPISNAALLCITYVAYSHDGYHQPMSPNDFAVNVMEARGSESQRWPTTARISGLNKARRSHFFTLTDIYDEADIELQRTLVHLNPIFTRSQARILTLKVDSQSR